jgi:hypothetical protein
VRKTAPLLTVPAILALGCALTTPLRAQDIGEQIGALASGNAEGYVGPLARGLGHALTAGFVSSADPHGALGFSVGARVVGSLFTDEDETFAVVLPASVAYSHPLLPGGSRTYQNPYAASRGGRSPSVAGDGDGAVLSPSGQFRSDLLLTGSNPNDFNVEFPEGLDFPAAPFAVIDAAVGIGFGTQIMARFVPTLDLGNLIGVDEVGDVSAFGVGVMHNLTQWLPIPTPFWDVSLVAGTQKMEAGNYLEASGTTLGLVASAGLGPLSVYAHGSTYKASLDVDYTAANPSNNPALPPDGTRVQFEQEVERTQRLAIGAQLDLILMKLSAEYGTGDYRTISARVAFGLR